MRDSVFSQQRRLSFCWFNEFNEFIEYAVSSIRLEHHAWIRRCAAGRQPLRQAARMGFQLVAVRIEKIQGIAGAAILLPFHYPGRAQAGGKGGEVLLRDGKA